LLDSLPTRLDLFSNPGVVLEARTYGGLPLSLIFGTVVSHQGGQSFADTIQFTYEEEGIDPVVRSQSFTTGVDPITLGFGFLFEPIQRTGTPIPTTLKVELLNSSPDFVLPGGPYQGRSVDSYTYSFSTQAPVPEPSTVVLVLTGLAALGRKHLLRRREP
jgi:hypothetical protein